MKPEIFKRATELNKAIKNIQKTIEILDAEFETGGQTDIDDYDNDTPGDPVAIEARAALVVKLEVLRHEFRGL